MGRLTSDPQTKTVGADNVPVTSFTLAVQRNFGNKEGTRSVDFLDVVAWRNNATFVSKFFSKGQLMLVHGELQTRTYETQNNEKRKVYEINANEIHFCGDKRENTAPASPIEDENEEDEPF